MKKMRLASSSSGSYDIEEKKTYPWMELYSAFTAATSFLSAGVIHSITPKIMDSMSSEQVFSGTISPGHVHWMAATPWLGAVVGAILSIVLLEFVGRKRTIVFLMTLFIPAWLVTGLAVNSQMLFAGVALIGFSAGIAFVVIPIYIAETARPTNRGTLGTLPSMMLAAGTAVIIGIGPTVNWKTTAYSLAGICKITALMSIWLPESATWLLLNRRETEANTSLLRIRGEDRSNLVRKELDEILLGEEQIEESLEGRRSLNVMRRQVIWWPTWLALSLMAFQQLVGINGVIHSMRNILKDVERMSNGQRPALVPVSGSIVEGIAIFLPFALTFLLIDWAGRRALLLTSCFLIILCHTSLGVYFYSCRQHIFQIVNLTPWLPSASLYLLLAAYSIGLASVPSIVMAEMLPARFRGYVCAMCVAVNSLAGFVVIHFFEDLRYSLFPGYAFWLFGIICGIACIVIIFAMPETKGKSLARVQQIFDDNVGYWTEAKEHGGDRAVDDKRKGRRVTFTRVGGI